MYQIYTYFLFVDGSYHRIQGNLCLKYSLHCCIILKKYPKKCHSLCLQQICHISQDALKPIWPPCIKVHLCIKYSQHCNLLQNYEKSAKKVTYFVHNKIFIFLKWHILLLPRCSKIKMSTIIASNPKYTSLNRLLNNFF